MEIAVIVFLSSGLFLGWSLGANDAANVFGNVGDTVDMKHEVAHLVLVGELGIGVESQGQDAVIDLVRLGLVRPFLLRSFVLRRLELVALQRRVQGADAALLFDGGLVPEGKIEGPAAPSQGRRHPGHRQHMAPRLPLGPV